MHDTIGNESFWKKVKALFPELIKNQIKKLLLLKIEKFQRKRKVRSFQRKLSQTIKKWLKLLICFS